jgi:hypothetical protein
VSQAELYVSSAQLNWTVTLLPYVLENTLLLVLLFRSLIFFSSSFLLTSLISPALASHLLYSHLYTPIAPSSLFSSPMRLSSSLVGLLAPLLVHAQSGWEGVGTWSSGNGAVLTGPVRPQLLSLP